VPLSIKLIFILLLMPFSRAVASDLRSPSFFEQVGRDFKGASYGIYQNKNSFLLASGLVILARQYDFDMDQAWGGRGRLGEWQRVGNEVVGTGIPGAAFAIGSMVYGMSSDSGIREGILPFWYRSGLTHLEAIASTAVIVSVAKLATQKERPNQADSYSFPSGHTSTAFASATIIYGQFGPWYGVPAYGLALLTGLSRISARDHWLADTVAGGAIGVLVATAFLSNERAQSAEETFGSSEKVGKINSNFSGNQLDISRSKGPVHGLAIWPVWSPERLILNVSKRF
jgi:predicted membrane protein